jgi:hypothetical protein
MKHLKTSGNIFLLVLMVSILGACAQQGYVQQGELDPTQRAVVNEKLPQVGTGEPGEMAGHSVSDQDIEKRLNSVGMLPADPTAIAVSGTEQVGRLPANEDDVRTPTPTPMQQTTTVTPTMTTTVTPTMTSP